MTTGAVTNEGAVPGREEELVRSLRAHLRTATSLREQGEREQASHKEGVAAALLDQLTQRLAPRFERYARAAFRAGPDDLALDAVQEMFLLLCERVQDLSPKQQYWEERFNRCAKLLEYDAVRTVRRRSGLDEKGQPKTPDGGHIVSWDEPAGPSDEGIDSLTIGEQVADPTTGDGFALGASLSRALGPLLEAQLLAALPRDQQQIFVDHQNGITWEEIAHRAGMSVSTAQDRLKRARVTLQAILSGGPQGRD